MMEHFQHALLSLYTNQVLLDAFEKDPDTTIGGLTLSDREKRALKRLPIKELRSFQRGLLNKRMGFAKLCLQRKAVVVLLPFWKDTPALIWGSHENPTIVPVRHGAARLLRELYAKRKPLATSSLVEAYSGLMTQVGLRDLFSLARLIYSQKLTGGAVYI